MKRFLLTTVSFGVLALPAMAADLAPVYKEQVAWTWTGFYFGGTVGGGWMTSDATESVTSTFCNETFNACDPLQSGHVADKALAGGIPGALNTTQAGFLAGVEVGYNWQFGRYVFGFETDLSGANISGSSTFSNKVSVVGFPGDAVSTYGSYHEKLDYFGTVRARAGFLVTDPLLLYVTGGFAYGDASASNSIGTEYLPSCGVLSLCAKSAIAESSSSSRVGWTIGGGLEWMFARNFTVKGEYLYYDFGSVSYPGPSVSAFDTATAPPAPFYGATTSATAAFKGSIFRVGLNFKL